MLKYEIVSKTTGEVKIVWMSYTYDFGDCLLLDFDDHAAGCTGEKQCLV